MQGLCGQSAYVGPSRVLSTQSSSFVVACFHSEADALGPPCTLLKLFFMRTCLVCSRASGRETATHTIVAKFVVLFNAIGWHNSYLGSGSAKLALAPMTH